MAVELVRIDDRMIHGQVITTWVNKFNIEQILVVNDVVVNDPIQKAGIMMTAPSNIQIRIFGVDELLSLLKKTEIKKRTLIILINTDDALRLAKNGLSFQVLNLGGLRAKENSRRFTKAIALNDQDVENLKEILSRGIDIQIQMIPKDELIYFKDLIEKEMEK